jgi:hypothetical protein
VIHAGVRRIVGSRQVYRADLTVILVGNAGEGIEDELVLVVEVTPAPGLEEEYPPGDGQSSAPKVASRRLETHGIAYWRRERT